MTWHKASPLGARSRGPWAWTILLAANWFTLGCSDGPSNRGVKVPTGAPPRAADAPRNRFADPVLRRLANAGASIELNVGSKWNGPGTSINFRNMTVDAETLSGLSHVQETVFLSFARCRFKGGALKPLNGMRNLNSLAFHDGAGDEAALSDLTALPSLERFVAGLRRGPLVDDLAFLKTAKGLTNLGLEGAGVHDEVLALVAEHDHLIEIDLWSTSITDRGLSYLGRLHRLMRLTINHCHITDAGVHHLVGLNELRSLALEGTSVTGSSLGVLRALPNLHGLDVRLTKVADDGLAEIAQLLQLESLDLSQTEITDDGIGDLVRLPHLTSLVLRDTQVTDVGLEKLAATGIGYIDAIHTAATRAARRALPKATILLDEDDPKN